MTVAAPTPRPRGRPSAIWLRLGVLVAALVMALVIWGGQIYLTRSFSEDQNADATVRATLYAGSLQSALQRHSVVPLLLSRDPILIEALRGGDFLEADERLATFREEIGAGSIFLLDAEGRVVAASDDRPRGDRRGRPRLLHAADRGRGEQHRLLDHRRPTRAATASTIRAGVEDGAASRRRSG